MENKNRIGIVTFHDTVNYGGVLQCFALQQVLLKMGWDPYVINYKREQRLKNSGSLLRRIVGSIVRTINGPLGARERKTKTEEFVARAFSGLSVPYSSLAELQQNPPPGNTYIVGSDQVWNPQIVGWDGAYFLKFGQEEVKRISYGASIGLDTLNREQISELSEGLAGFEKISVREDTAKDIIQSNLGLDCEQVLDPTLLMEKEDWKSRATEKPGRKYLLVYVLPGNTSVEKGVRKASEVLAEAMGLEICVIGDREIKRLTMGKKNLFGVGPQDFIDLVCNASFIVTNSFHGTAFAANLSVPFLSVIPEQSNHSSLRSGRLVSLANLLGLESRVIETVHLESALLDANRFGELDDLTVASEKLAHARQESIDWLERALS